jgi:transposase
LVNTAAVKQYDGLKHSGDFSDARHLAHLLRLGILPEGYIYPREQRAVRDLMRKRSQLVRQRSSQILSMQNLVARNLGAQCSGNDIKRWDDEDIDAMNLLDDQKLALKANLAVMDCLDRQVHTLERRILASTKLSESFQALKSVSGVGDVLALTIALETGDIGRFASPGHFASYARTVDSRRSPTARRRAKATPSAATSTWPGPSSRRRTLRCATTPRSSAGTRRSARSSLSVVAIKAVAHKLARACWHVMKDGRPFEASRAFG